MLPPPGTVPPLKGRCRHRRGGGIGDSNFIMAGHEHRQWPAEGLSSTGLRVRPCCFQPDPQPHRPLTRHGAAPPNMIQSALLLPSCQLCKLVAGLPSAFLAAWGYCGGDLPRCRCWHLSCCWRQRSVYLKPIHNCQCIRACRQVCQGIYARELCDPSSTLGRAEADKLLSLPFDDSLRGTRLELSNVKSRSQR